MRKKLTNNMAKGLSLLSLTWNVSSETILLGGDYSCGLGWAGSHHRLTTFNTHDSHLVVLGISRGVSKTLTLKYGLLL